MKVIVWEAAAQPFGVFENINLNEFYHNKRFVAGSSDIQFSNFKLPFTTQREAE